MRRSFVVVCVAVSMALSFLTVERVARASAESPMRLAGDRAVALAGPDSGLGGSIFTLAGGGARPARAGLLAAEVQIRPGELALTRSGELLFSDQDRVFGVGRDGRLRLIAGRGGFDAPSGDGGPATRAALGGVDDLAVGPDGSIYILSFYDSTVRRVTPGGRIVTAAGRASRGPDVLGDGGRADRASLRLPTGIDVQRDGSLLIADQSHHRVRRVTPDGRIATVLGNGMESGSGDHGPAALASTRYPADVAVASDGGFFVCDRVGPVDSTGWRIRRVAADGTISTIARIGAESARLAVLPDGTIAFKPGGFQFHAHQIRRVGRDGRVTLLVHGRSSRTLLDGDTTNPNRMRLMIGNPVPDHDGGLLFADSTDGVRYLPPQHPGRLAVGFAERSVSARRPRSLRIALTRAATVRVSASADGRTLWTTTRNLLVGTSTIRLPRHDTTGVHVLEAIATDASMTASDRLTLLLGPRMPVAIARDAIAAAYREQGTFRVAPCRPRSPNRVDCAVLSGGVCQRIETVSRMHYGELRRRSYEGGHDAHCDFHARPRWRGAPHPIPVPEARIP